MAVNYVKFQRGSQAAYNKLLTDNRVDDNTLYFIYPEDNSTVGKLYLGSRLISGGDVVLTAASLDDLADVITTNAGTNDFLVFNGTNWIAKTLADVVALIQDAMGEIAAPANVFQVIRTADHVSDIAAIESVIPVGTLLAAGDSAIVKKLIAEGTESNDKYQHTAYVYGPVDEGYDWIAMDGNYNAENVYFDSDFTLAGAYTTVGNIALSDKTLLAKGKSLEQLLQSIFTKELYPATGSSRDLPSIALSGDSDKSGEVGSTFTLPAVTLTVSDVGAYTYGPATGIVFETGNLTIAEGAVDTATNKKSNTSNAAKGATLSLTASDGKGTVYTDSAISYTFNAKGTYTQGAMPVTNLGNDYADARIDSDTVTATARTIQRSGWRNYWYGFVSTTDAANLTRITDSEKDNYNAVTDGIKTLTAGGAAISNKTLPTITAASGDRMPVVVFPTSANKKVVSASMPSSLNAPVTFTFIKTVNLAGYNGASAVSYDVWGYVADDMPIGADFSIVIGNK